MSGGPVVLPQDRDRLRRWHRELERGELVTLDSLDLPAIRHLVAALDVTELEAERDAAVSEALMVQDYEAENKRLSGLARDLYGALVKAIENAMLDDPKVWDEVETVRARYEQEGE